MPSQPESNDKTLINYKKLILQTLELSKEYIIKKNRNTTFENGFIEGVESITQIILECALATNNFYELEQGLKSFHCAAHLLSGEHEDSNGVCEYIRKHTKDRISYIIAQVLLEDFDAPVKEEVEKIKPMSAPPVSSKPN